MPSILAVSFNEGPWVPLGDSLTAFIVRADSEGRARRLASDHCVRLRLLAQAPFVMCMVADPGHGIPVLQDSDLAAESGRGLTVVEACCVRWGWHLLDDGGKVVWALLR